MVDATPKSFHHQHTLTVTILSIKTDAAKPKGRNFPCIYHATEWRSVKRYFVQGLDIQTFGNFSKQVILGYWSKHIWASNTGTLGRAIHARATDQLLNSATRGKYTLEAKTCTGQFSAWQLSVNKEWKTAKHAQGMINSLHAETPLSTAWCFQINLCATFRVHFRHPWGTDWQKP